ELKKFTDSGGLLIVDACGGSGEFATAVESEMAALFGPADAQQLQTVLPPGDPVFSAGGARIDEFGYRQSAQKMLVGRTHAPQLRAIERNGKPVLYYSPQDLSVGMVGQSVEGIFGYDPKTATEVMRNILLQASGSGAAVAVAAAPPPAESTAAPAPPPPEQKPAAPPPPSKPEQKHKK